MKLINSAYKIIPQSPGLDGIYKAIESAGRTCYQSVGTRYFKIPSNNKSGLDLYKNYIENKDNADLYYSLEQKENSHTGEIGNIWVSIANKKLSEYSGLQKFESPFNKVYHKNVTAEGFVDRMIMSGHHAMLEFGTVYAFYPLNCYEHDYETLLKVHGNQYTKMFVRNETSDTEKNGYYVTTNYRVILENISWGEDVMKHLCEPTEFHEKRVTVHFVCDRGVSHELVRHKQLCVA